MNYPILRDERHNTPASTTMRASKSRALADVPTSVGGIPCIARVTTYRDVKGSFRRDAPSDMDYHGYTEIEYDLCDRKGYLAPWLEAKVDSRDDDRIRQDIVDYMHRDAE